MKKLFKKLFRGICITIGIILSCLVGLTICISCIQMTPPDYVKTVKTGGPLEAKYLAVGPYSVQYMEVAAAEPMKQIAVYYPTDMADGVRYPVVVFINGTGVYASKYKALFHHLASWGLIVAGNEDPSTWSGKSADETLGWMSRQFSGLTFMFTAAAGPYILLRHLRCRGILIVILRMTVRIGLS